MQEQTVATIDLRGMLGIFRKRIGSIILIIFIVTVLGSVYTFFIATPKYTATTQLVVKLPSSDNSVAYAGQVTGNIQMANTINQVITSPAILDKVNTNLNLGSNVNLTNNISATNTTNSQVITINVTYSNPYTAQKIANETAKVFSDNAQSILNVTNVSVLASATVNTSPVSPKPKFYISISVIVGLIIGLGFALLTEALNNKVRTEEDIIALGFNSLGSTPYVDSKDLRVGYEVGTLHKEVKTEVTLRRKH
ncbi:Wzz/FepE/Etk N-terminal domain-containing protein [Lactovum miscens]|uniref:Capsular polysaccharide biosynthesis protein CpsC n=1 Tax=Lactovum miscens TaxID=190387 RepID=A0A841C6T0_9LACT|nr:Wzz/FepE/Etk N-terminal domain-containing protein [Lactovum miscens]MBB5887987.1 capsular polysaccharide biosynthesis protein [Lactovum miscens]